MSRRPTSGKTLYGAGAFTVPAFDYLSLLSTNSKRMDEQLKALEKHPDLKSFHLHILSAHEEFLTTRKTDKEKVYRLKQTLSGIESKYRTFGTIFVKHAFRMGYSRVTSELAKYVLPFLWCTHAVRFCDMRTLVQQLFCSAIDVHS